MKGSSVRVEKVQKYYGHFKAIDSVSFEIKKGEFFSLLGPSGCGKTTLLRIIAGFEDPSDGIVLIDDVNVIPIPANKRHVNTVFQSYALFPHLSVFDNIAFPLRLKKAPEHEIKNKVTEYLELVKLPSEIKKFPAQLSGGQKQRVAIARALINQPNVLLLDEPLSALDAKLRQHMLIELDAIHDKIGITFIYVTHDQQEALSVSDRVAVMNQGVIHQIGSPVDIYESPADKFVAQFIGETNYLTGKVTRIIDDQHAETAIEGIGNIQIFLDKPVQPGNTIKLTVRPEKVRVSTEPPPEKSTTHINILQGTVDEIIYSGFQSKYFVKIGMDTMFRVFRQHLNFFTDEKNITWKESVFVWWYPKDGFIVEVEPL